MGRKALARDEVADNRARRLRALWNAWPAPKPSKEAFERFGRHAKVGRRSVVYVVGWMREGVSVLGIPQKTLTNLVMKSPQVLGFKPERLRDYAEGSARVLGVSYEMYLRVVVAKDAHVLYWSPDELAVRVTTFAEMLGIARERVLRMVCLRPNLLLMSPASVQRKARETAQILGVELKALVAVAATHPQLLYQAPERMRSNIALSARYLDVSEGLFIGAGLRCPQLFSSRPQTLAQKSAILRELCGELTVRFEDLLDRHPLALMYGVPRLQQRLTMARAGLGTGNIVSLLSMASSKAEALLGRASMATR